MASAATRKRLQNELKYMTTHPLGFFRIELKENNIFEWLVWMKGPDDSDYEGGIFKMLLTFSPNYPFEPPKLVFVDDFWHPNVYPDGKVCISILHPPEEDAMSGEDVGERWRPIHTPESILLSVLSMLSDPNFSSPANVDASVEWRRNKPAYRRRVSGLIKKGLSSLPPGFSIPDAVPPPRPAKPVELDVYDYDGEFEVVIDDDDDEDVGELDFSDDGEFDGELGEFDGEINSDDLMSVDSDEEL